MKNTLHWILGKINKVNELADKLVVQQSALQRNKDAHSDSNSLTRDALSDAMKRRIESDSKMDNNDPRVEERMHQRRRSLATVMSSNDGTPSMGAQSPYHPAMENSSQRHSNMNPPPAPNRQLPSPPGRSFPSPTPAKFSSPSGSSYGVSAAGHSQPPNAHGSNLLPPITAVHSSEPALQAHTAALQHEVSVQKIALSSLQGEHDKLLAAFSRSQTRASALEKKHAVSDGEIISLTEEKMRLQSQVVDLEKDVEDLAKSRDEFRQAAVQEGAQYVEIVKKATLLEEKTGEERRSWTKLKNELEQRIEELSSRANNTAEASVSVPQVTDEMRTSPSTMEAMEDLKVEEITRRQSIEPISPSALHKDHVDHLREEVERLRKRCEEVEGALQAVRDDSRSMENIVEALSKAGKGIIQRVEEVSSRPESIPES